MASRRLHSFSYTVPSWTRARSASTWQRRKVVANRYLIITISGQRNATVLECYVALIDYHQVDLDEALRRFLGSFRLPGEAQMIERLLDAFAHAYHKANPKQFTSSGTGPGGNGDPSCCCRCSVLTSLWTGDAEYRFAQFPCKGKDEPSLLYPQQSGHSCVGQSRRDLPWEAL